MKKILGLIATPSTISHGLAIYFFASTAFSQTENIAFPGLLPAKQYSPYTSVRYGSAATPLNLYSFYIDYDSADAAYWGAASYARQMWLMNDAYTTSDSAFKYFIVAFDTIQNSYAFISYPNSVIYQTKIDSISMRIGHENNSGTADTIIVKIINLTTAGYPTTSVLWADTLITSTGLSTANNWLNPTIISFAPLFTDSINRFGVCVEYNGSTQDTLGFVAGYPTFTAPCDTVPSVLSRKSNYYPNSVAYFTSLGFQIPTASGTGVYYDCNGNSGYDPGTDGENFIENINLRCYVEISTNPAGISDHTFSPVITLLQNFPNPFSGKTRIDYLLSENSEVKFEIYDLIGEKRLEKNEGIKNSGKHFFEFNSLSLENGIYFYSLSAGGEKITRKMTLLK